MSNRPAVREDPTALIQVCRTLALRRRASSSASADREDLEQEACLRVLGTDNPASIRDPLRYLMRVTRNLFVDSRRRKQRETIAITSMDASAVATEFLHPERILSGKQDLQRALEAIDLLPLRCREAFVLHRFHDLSYSAVARRMGVSPGTIEKHIAEAMLRITRALTAPGDRDG